MQNNTTTNITIENTFKEKDKKLYVFSRWAALYEAVNIIADKTEEKQLSFEDVELKPLKILEYIDSTSDIIMRKLTEKRKNKKQIEK